MKLNKLALAVAAVTSVATAGNALAIQSLTTGGGQTWHFTNWETRIVPTTATDGSVSYNTLEGLIRIDQIFDANGNTLFSTNANEEIVGYFTGIQVINFTEALGAPFNFSGGEIKLWYDTTPDFNPSFNPVLGSGGPNSAGPGDDHGTVYAPNATPTDQFTLSASNGSAAVGSGITDGVLWADVLLDTGMNPFNPLATLSGGIRALPSVDDGFGSVALQGDGAAFGSIIGGSAFDVYNTNGYNGGKSDFRLDNTFFITQPFGNTTNGWDTHSDDPVKLNAIPEPASLALLGLGLLGMGALRRRQK